MKPHVETSDTCIAYVDLNNRQITYNRKGHCGSCDKCLVSPYGTCPFGGPFNDTMEVDLRSFVPLNG